jgi:predicted DNA-binding helix-hairpin-helix protein
MKFINRIAAAAALTALVCTSVSAFADDHGYTEGIIVNVARIRTVDGKFDDYMHWVATKWKAQQEAAKKAGYLLSYEVITVEPRTPDDPDLLLVSRYKNWAALDGAMDKADAVTKATGSTVAESNKAQVERASIRRVLGSSTMQVLDLQ